MARRSGLGRGLSSLIPSEVTSSPDSVLRDVPLASIQPNRFQPRRSFDEESLSSLVDSIQAVGVLQPVLLRESEEGEYELIAGERRCRAARRAGLQSIPALVQRVTDVSSLEHALVENLHREDLNPLDEAAAYQQLIEEFHLTHEEVARRVGRSRVAVTNALRVFQLPPSVQRLVQEQSISSGHARALLMSPDRELQERLARETVEETLSVRALEERVRATLAPEPSMDGVDAGEVVGAEDGSEKARVGSRHHAVGRLRPPGILELEELLADRLNTRVRVEMGGRHGKVVIDFANLEDLERIYRSMIGEPST